MELETNQKKLQKLKNERISLEDTKNKILEKYFEKINRTRGKARDPKYPHALAHAALKILESRKSKILQNLDETHLLKNYQFHPIPQVEEVCAYFFETCNAAFDKAQDSIGDLPYEDVAFLYEGAGDCYIEIYIIKEEFQSEFPLPPNNFYKGLGKAFQSYERANKILKEFGNLSSVLRTELSSKPEYKDLLSKVFPFLAEKTSSDQINSCQEKQMILLQKFSKKIKESQENELYDELKLFEIERNMTVIRSTKLRDLFTTLKRDHEEQYKALMGAYELYFCGGIDNARQVISSCRNAWEHFIKKVTGNQDWKLGLKNLIPSQSLYDFMIKIWGFFCGFGSHSSKARDDDAYLAIRMTEEMMIKVLKEKQKII